MLFKLQNTIALDQKNIVFQFSFFKKAKHNILVKISKFFIINF